MTPHARVLYVLSSQPLITVGPDSYIHQMIALAHGINIGASASGAYPRLNMETVLEKNPEVLIFPVGSTESVSDSERQTWSRWTGLSAVQHRRLHVVSSDALNRPGPRVVEGLEQLARAIHPRGVLLRGATVSAMTFSPPPASSLSSSPRSVPADGTLADPVFGRPYSTRSRWLRIMSILLVVAIILTILCLQVGARYVGVGEIVGSFGRAIGVVGGDEAHMTTDTIVWHLRVPRVFLGFLVGCSLAWSASFYKRC